VCVTVNISVTICIWYIRIKFIHSFQYEVWCLVLKYDMLISRNTPTNFAPSSARRNFYKCAPSPQPEILDPPLNLTRRYGVRVVSPLFENLEGLVKISIELCLLKTRLWLNYAHSSPDVDHWSQDHFTIGIYRTPWKILATCLYFDTFKTPWYYSEGNKMNAINTRLRHQCCFVKSA